jgi:hypothetical protein
VKAMALPVLAHRVILHPDHEIGERAAERHRRAARRWAYPVR